MKIQSSQKRLIWDSLAHFVTDQHVINKGKSAIPPLSLMVLMSCLLHVTTQSSSSEIFCLDDTGSSLFAFPSRINLKPDIYAAPKMAHKNGSKKAITTLDLSKASGPLIVLLCRIMNVNFHNTCSLIFSIQVERNLILLIAGKLDLWSACLKILGRVQWLNTTTPKFLFLLLVKFEKLIDNKLVLAI